MLSKGSPQPRGLVRYLAVSRNLGPLRDLVDLIGVSVTGMREMLKRISAVHGMGKRNPALKGRIVEG